MMLRPAWPIRPAIDWRGSRLTVLALVVLGHLALLAWWWEHPTPATREESPLLQGRLLRIDIQPAPAPSPLAQTPARSSRVATPVSTQPSSAHLAQAPESMSVAPAVAEATEARTLDLSAPVTPSHTRSQAESNLAGSATRGTGHAFRPDAASTPRAAGAIQESRGAAGRWQANVEVGGSAYCLNAQDPSLRRDPFEKALAVPSICR